MQNLHDDKNLDSLSRDAAENFQPDASLHSWEQLKPGLDKELPEKKEKKRRIIFFLFLFMLVGGGIVSSVIWFSGNKTQQIVTTGAGNKPATPGTTATGNTTNTDKVTSTTPPAPVTNPQASVDVVTNDDNPQRTDVRVNAGRTNQTARRNNPVTDTKNDVAKDVVSKQQPPVTDDKAVMDNKTVTEDKVVTEDKAVTDNTITDKAVTDEKVVTDNKATPKKEEPAVAEDKPATTKAKLTSTSRNPSVAASRWEFGAVYAPDVSTVKFSHTQKPGTNVGLTVGYNISRRFSIQAGAIYTTKNYRSRGSDYHPPKGYWTEYVKLETVTADCDMWDIPINLRYNLVPKHRTNLFVSTGLSSYLMKSEDYYYRYYYVNNPNPMYRERAYDTNTQHWGAVLNFSLGYERQLSKSFSVQAEPFFKQPLKGVGFGKVKLNSTGIYFSVKYKPVSKSRSK